MKRTLALLTTAIIMVTSLQAQEDGGYNESVIVRGAFLPDINPGEKLHFPATVTDSMEHIERTFNYSITPTRLKALYEPTRIKAARIVGEPTTRLYNNYFRLGMGNYWSPLADLYWNSTRDRKKTYGIRLNHRSSWGSLNNVGSAEAHSDAARAYGSNQTNQTSATLFGKYIIGEQLQLSSDLSYEHDHNLYYGFNDSTLQSVLGQSRNDIALHDYRASYNVATWNIGISNMELDANKLGYAADIHINDLWGVWGQNELNLNLNGDVHYGFNIANQYKGIAYLHAEWDAYRNSHPSSEMPLGYSLPLQDDTLTAFSNIVSINPYAVFLISGLNIHAGVTMGWDGCQRHNPTQFMFFPDVSVSKSLLKDNIVLSLAATGGIKAVSLNSIRLLNPYIAPDYTATSSSHYDFIGHARWTFSRKLEANAEVSYSLLYDPTFKLSTCYALNNVYEVVFNNMNRLTVGADVTFVNDEMITLRVGGHYYHYDFTDLGATELTWSRYYRPDWDALLSLDLNYQYKWFFHLEGQLLGKMDSDNGDIPMRYGIAAQVEYRHNRALSFFLQADNLAFQRYWYWANYPSQLGLFTLGLTYTIPQK